MRFWGRLLRELSEVFFRLFVCSMERIRQSLGWGFMLILAKRYCTVLMVFLGNVPN